MADENQTVNDLSQLGEALQGAGGADVVAAAAETSAPAEPQIDAQGRAYATGKRKNAIARVWIKPGSGRMTVNGKEVSAYFGRPVLQTTEDGMHVKFAQRTVGRKGTS